MRNERERDDEERENDGMDSSAWFPSKNENVIFLSLKKKRLCDYYKPFGEKVFLFLLSFLLEAFK